MKDGSNPESPFFSTTYFRFSSKKQKMIHYHHEFFLIHFAALASEIIIRLHCGRLQVICTIIQNMLIVVIVILRIRCNRYFTLSENQVLVNLC